MGTSDTVCVRMSGVKFSYGGKAPYLLQNVEFNARYGDRVAIMGENGQGKSTLLKIIAGITHINVILHHT